MPPPFPPNTHRRHASLTSLCLTSLCLTSAGLIYLCLLDLCVSDLCLISVCDSLSFEFFHFCCDWSSLLFTRSRTERVVSSATSLRIAVEHFNDVPHAAIQPHGKRRVLQQLRLSACQGTSYCHPRPRPGPHGGLVAGGP